MDLILQLTGLLIFLLGFAAFWVSFDEKELRAAKYFLVIAIIFPMAYFLLAILETQWKTEASTILLGLTYIPLLLFLIPAGKRKSWRQSVPEKQIDERDTMFSRRELIPGSEAFDIYYTENPELRELDDLFRRKAGLLRPGSTQYNPIQFAAADASFETIAALKAEVDGPINELKTATDPIKITEFLGSWAKKLGAVDCGFTTLQPYHLYSIGGRAERRDKPVVNKHKYAIAMTVEMDKTMVSAAPSGTIVMESAQQYLESGIIALQMASFIRNLGYPARAHIDGNYEVVCPLVAKDAGLGEIGRMGLLMTPKLGPRVRIAVVTTDLPIVTDQPMHSYPTIDFCKQCKKCAEACPSNAISFDKPKDLDGVKRWQINQEACFTLWCTTGTDCGRCMSVCPYSHPDNWLHNMVRFGIQNSSLFRPLALKLDDVFYGRKPAVAPQAKWTQPIKPKPN